jgi:Cu/Zn superoxide dismutase
MKNQKLILLALSLFVAMTIMSCEKDNDSEIIPTDNKKEYTLAELNDSGVSGKATFTELSDGSIEVNLDLSGTPSSGVHPAHIHFNSAAEGGGIAIGLEPVDGASGSSISIVNSFDDGMPISFDELLAFDGHINVHLSASELQTIVAQADIGVNKLTGSSVTYELGEKAVEGINGTATFYERENGEALAVLEIVNTPEGGIHPAHIHANTAVEGGGVLFSFNTVDGNTGISRTNLATYDDGTTLLYADIESIDGYINVHLSADNLGTIVAQGDIGQNTLTGASLTYDLGERAIEGIGGTATFYERANGEALAVLELANTPEGGNHPAHIHANTAVEGGGILFSFNALDGTSGIGQTNLSMYDDGEEFGYADLEQIDAYINVHLSADDLGTIVAQGDIGQNELTGNSISYDLGEKAVQGINGTITFFERKNGESLAVLELVNTPEGGTHPAHIHANPAAVGGGILFSFNPVDGTTGISQTNVAGFDDGGILEYTDIELLDGHINVHLSANELKTILAQGDIGINEGASSNAYDVTNSGASAYVFNGNGLTNSQNPDLTLTRGETYTFAVSAAGHPFWIKSSQSTGAGDVYNSGVTNNGAESGTVTFTVPADAPDTLYYICQFHGSMTGTLTITD